MLIDKYNMIAAEKMYEDGISFLRGAIKPNMDTGPWIAGGFPLSLIAGIPIGASDIDVWCVDRAQSDEVRQRLYAAGAEVVCVTANAISYQLNRLLCIGDENRSTWKIQIILKDYASYHEVVDDFDIDICRVVTDLTFVYVEDTTIDAIKDRTFNVTWVGQGSLHRFCKYIWKGFKPTQESIDLMHVHHAVHEWKIKSEVYMF